MPTVALFAGSKTPPDPEILRAATILGCKLAEAGYDITYGGGTQGVMGAVARAALAAGGKVNSVMLEKCADEPQFPGANVIHVKTEQERFIALTTYNNPVISFAMPGSVSTMREIFQALEAAVYENGTPVVLVSTGKSASSLKDAFDFSIADGLTKADKADKLKIWPVTGDLAEVLPPASPKGGIPGLYQGFGR